MPEVNPNITSNLSGITTNNPLMIRGGRQVPNPNYTGPHPYKMDAAGKLTRIVPPQSGLSKFTQQILGYGTKAFNAATPVLKNAAIGTGRLLAGRSDGSELPFLAAMATSDTIDAFNPQGVIDRQKRNEARNAVYGQLPSDYKRTELLASGQVPGGLPSDYKETEEAAGLSAERYRAGAGFPEQQNRPTDSDGGIDTRTGRKYDSFQEQQQDLMNKLAGRADVPDEQTAALIRGGPANPFSSNQLPYTDDNLYTNFGNELDLSGFGVDPSKMLQSAGNVNYSEATKDLPGFGDELALKDSFTDGYVSPVNGAAPQNAGDPMLNPNIKSGMTAMRMKDRDLGLMYASGQFFAEGKDGKPVLVNRELAKSVRRGDAGAADELAAYLGGDGIKPQGGVISDPPRELMVPPKTEETKITSVSGEFKPAMPKIGSYSDQGVASTSDLFSKLVEEEVEMPDFSRKLGLSYGTQPNTGVYNPFNSEFRY